ncbi:lycopene cyclase family protein [Polaromonas sp. CG_9.11]|uniref:lycopene cyclase family protein n=1 Tax=Polaromonas sp. CG_9.11 TaxID=2787730 RepID=UPI0018C927F3|nr:lycopene cyclase family protein [Polaromonas sp. CG_9.11]MBG6075874.1 lycopene beta-cyclase [Polaromonas sp. CG_9.11]
MAFDIVIVGGGLSGLALAAELAQAEFSKLRVLVLEQRKSYVRDRTWSYWKTPHNAAHRYSHLERQQWSQWCVRQGVSTHQQASPTVTKDGEDGKATCYCTLDGDAFYSAAQSAIAKSGHVELRLGTSVRQIVGGDTPSVETSEGEVIQAAWVFDARPPIQTNENRLVQQFLGREITTNSDVFDPTMVELMHFQPSTAGLHFFYVLPYSPRNALIETTWISPASVKPDFDTELQQFIASFVGSAAYEVVYEEKGSLNLSLSHTTPNHALHVARLGRGAGTLRASTGYAFLETLAHSAQIAMSLKSHAGTGDLKNWIPAAFKRHAIDEWMDTVFLTVLERDWSRSSWYFMQLFERLDAETMVAFLSGKASWRQRLLVTRALPTLPFSAQALSLLFKRASKLSGVSH